ISVRILSGMRMSVSPIEAVFDDQRKLAGILQISRSVSHGLYPVTTGLLRPVKGFVSGLEQIVEVVDPGCRVDGDAETCRDGERVVVCPDIGEGNFPANTLGDGQRRVQRDPRQKDNEFFAAKAAYLVIAARAIHQDIAHRHQYLVPGMMPPGVIDLLEMIEVEHDATEA